MEENYLWQITYYDDESKSEYPIKFGRGRDPEEYGKEIIKAQDEFPKGHAWKKRITKIEFYEFNYSIGKILTTAYS